MPFTTDILQSSHEYGFALASVDGDRLYAKIGDDIAEVVHVAYPKGQGTSVIVSGCYADEFGTVIPDTYDDQGNCLIRVTVAEIDRLLTRAEADVQQRIAEIDQSMLDNAY